MKRKKLLPPVSVLWSPGLSLEAVVQGLPGSLVGESWRHIVDSRSQQINHFTTHEVLLVVWRHECGIVGETVIAMRDRHDVSRF